MSWRRKLHRRSHSHGLHGHAHIANQRRVALVMIVTGLARVMIWITMLALFYAGAGFMVKLFGSVSFVSALSVGALLLTDWGQVAASLAQLTAGDAHYDAEQARVNEQRDYRQLDQDVARLAELQPGPEAHSLATDIRSRLGRTP